LPCQIFFIWQMEIQTLGLAPLFVSLPCQIFFIWQMEIQTLAFYGKSYYNLYSSKYNKFNLIIMSQQNNQNDQNNQIDPNFLPKDSNVYVRTMNSDLNNLKEQGGEALPYAKEPADIPKVTVNTHSTENIPADIPAATIKPSADEYNFADTENQPMSSQEQPMLTPENVPSGTPNIPLENQMPAQPVKENPEPVPDFSSINLTDPQNQPQEGFADQSPDQFETPDKVADSFNKPPEPFASPTQGFPAPMPEAQPSYPSPNEPTPANDSSFLDKSPIAEKTLGSIDFNQPVPEQKDNLSSDLNNLIAPEEFSPISNIDPNGSKNEPKNKLMLPLTILGILALLVVAYLLV
ncbi:MAG: hypothetical protein KO464_01455, partial [Candidatus Methanofastidiosum sp.]|nr:hypothetical protein [Methanofastidiosum sp.]